jgi:hypothetical protein
MATETTRITIYRGNPYTAALTFVDADGNPYDLTDKIVLFTVKELDDVTDTDSLAVIQKDITDAFDSTGAATLSLTDEDTNVAIGIYKWDIRVYEAPESSGEPETQFNTITGSCEVKDIVTKRR